MVEYWSYDGIRYDPNNGFFDDRGNSIADPNGDSVLMQTSEQISGTDTHDHTKDDSQSDTTGPSAPEWDPRKFYYDPDLGDGDKYLPMGEKSDKLEFDGMARTWTRDPDVRWDSTKKMFIDDQTKTAYKRQPRFDNLLHNQHIGHSFTYKPAPIWDGSSQTYVDKSTRSAYQLQPNGDYYNEYFGHTFTPKPSTNNGTPNNDEEVTVAPSAGASGNGSSNQSTSVEIVTDK